MAHTLKTFYLRLLEWMVIFSLTSILILVTANVFLRYVFNSGIFLSDGMSGLLFAWMTFIGSILVLYDHEHIGVDMLVRRLPVLLRRLCFGLIHIIMIYATWLLLTGSWTQMMINLHVYSPATRLPIAVLYAAGVLFAVASGLFLVTQLALLLTGRLNDADLVVSAGEDEAEADRVATDLGNKTHLTVAKVGSK
ncbi:TRAP transporter small permease [Microvirga lotononidis]|uniref:TRAP transporter small permease protein n=1 Tax=Microvirga lotononidis TaxID=864069 RepID=I4Z4C5_9HYPH|nr:TRAP transporter small permease [Microvirga lotononidis]EIM31067.1 TRAP-type C4-dicarboxylate transport system, small permease component [Microvirga lotononidis]WQO30528.1 TRAP transporter small permease [Microvirga lotononidis]